MPNPGPDNSQAILQKENSLPNTGYLDIIIVINYYYYYYHYMSLKYKEL